MLQKVDERRNLDRLDLYLKMFARETGERLSLTENIHCGGMSLMTVKPFITGEAIQVVIELPDRGETKRLMLTATSCWSVPGTKNLTHNIGFRFLYTSPEMRSFYETLFDGLGV